MSIALRCVTVVHSSVPIFEEHAVISNFPADPGVVAQRYNQAQAVGLVVLRRFVWLLHSCFLLAECWASE